MALTPGTRFGPYEVVSALGAGGMGEVYRARDTRLNRDVAIKVLPEALARDEEFQERFHREARTLSQIEHPHICPVYDVGTANGAPYLVMPLLEGDTLAQRLTKGRLSVSEALRIASEIADALDAAHRLGVVHRDLKPGNVMLTRAGARLLDFGLAKRAPAPSSGETTIAAGGPVTSRGTILGTVHYMAPEQLKGRDADARSDIYAFGVLLYEMLAGRRPFDAGDTASLIASILEHPVAPLSTITTIPPRLDRAIHTAVAKDPDERWQTIRDFARELRWIKDDTQTIRPSEHPAATGARISRRMWMGVAAAVALVAAVGVPLALNRGGGPPRNPRPVAVLMDSAHPQRVYDDATRKSGGTNADDLTDLLGDLGMTLLKETTGPSWHREDQILAQNPDLVVVHRSCFYDATLLPDLPMNEKYQPQLYPAAADKLEVLLGYIALANPRTKFIVYSRGSWETEGSAQKWTEAMERRFPRLRGRLVAFKVPLARPTFRHPDTGRDIKALVAAFKATETR